MHSVNLTEDSVTAESHAAKHTPGPWTRVDLEDYGTIRSDADEGSPVALVGKVADANAIAALPDLLAAAQEVVSFMEGRQPIKGWLRDTDGSRTALSKLLAAIAKATEA